MRRTPNSSAPSRFCKEGNARGWQRGRSKARIEAEDRSGAEDTFRTRSVASKRRSPSYPPARPARPALTPCPGFAPRVRSEPKSGILNQNRSGVLATSGGYAGLTASDFSIGYWLWTVSQAFLGRHRPSWPTRETSPRRARVCSPGSLARRPRSVKMLPMWSRHWYGRSPTFMVEARSNGYRRAVGLLEDGDALLHPFPGTPEWTRLARARRSSFLGRDLALTLARRGVVGHPDVWGNVWGKTDFWSKIPSRTKKPRPNRLSLHNPLSSRGSAEAFGDQRKGRADPNELGRLGSTARMLSNVGDPPVRKNRALRTLCQKY